MPVDREHSERSPPPERYSPIYLPGHLRRRSAPTPLTRALRPNLVRAVFTPEFDRSSHQHSRSPSPLTLNPPISPLTYATYPGHGGRLLTRTMVPATAESANDPYSGPDSYGTSPPVSPLSPPLSITSAHDVVGSGSEMEVLFDSPSPGAGVYFPQPKRNSKMDICSLLSPEPEPQVPLRRGDQGSTAPPVLEPGTSSIGKARNEQSVDLADSPHPQSPHPNHKTPSPQLRIVPYKPLAQPRRTKPRHIVPKAPSHHNHSESLPLPTASSNEAPGPSTSSRKSSSDPGLLPSQVDLDLDLRLEASTESRHLRDRSIPLIPSKPPNMRSPAVPALNYDELLPKLRLSPLGRGKGFKCDWCGTKLGIGAFGAVRHVLTHISPISRFQQPECEGMREYLEEIVEGHEELRRMRDRSKCPVCLQVLSRKDAVLRHMREMHRSVEGSPN